MENYFDNQNWTGRMDQLIHSENVEDGIRFSTEGSIVLRIHRESDWREVGMNSWLSQLRASRRIVNLNEGW
tara:strand:+ start:618 stop:830 length:213 start_codon:yes stop_codon:yes gene_type:complete